MVCSYIILGRKNNKLDEVKKITWNISQIDLGREIPNRWKMWRYILSWI